MLRAWILSFLAVGLVVGAILYFTQEKTPDADTPDKSAVKQTKPQSLTTNDVVKYLEVFPEVNATMYEVAKSGKSNRETMLAAIRPILATHQLSPESWDKLWRKVEDVVNSIRAEEGNPKRLDKIDRILNAKKAAAAAADGALKEQLERDIASIQVERDRTIVKVHPTDRKVVMAYWEQINRVAPRIGPK